MKFLVVVLVVSLGCANANIFDDLKNSLQTVLGAVEQTGKDFVPYANQVGKGLLNEAKNDTLSILGGTIGKLVGDGLSKLFHLKRDVPAMLQKSKQLMSELDSLLSLGNSQYSQVIDDVFKEIQQVSTLLSGLNIHPLTAIKQLEDLITKHESQAKEFLSAIERDVNSVVNKVFHKNKRSIITTLGSIVSGTFKPAVEGVKKLVTNTKEAVTTIAHNLLTTAKTQVSSLGEQLIPQFQTLKGQVKQLKTEGIDAASAVKDAVTDMLKTSQ